MLDSGQLISADNVTLLVTGIPAIEDLYAELGDAKAFALVQRHLARLRSIVRDERGDVVKTVGEGIVAAFEDASDAVKAAFQIDDRLANRGFVEHDDDAGEPEIRLTPSLVGKLSVAIGVHRGPVIVTTVNDRLDYFGAAVRQAVALPLLLETGVGLTKVVFSDAHVQEFLQNRGTDARLINVDLPGKPDEMVQHYGAKRSRLPG